MNSVGASLVRRPMAWLVGTLLVLAYLWSAAIRTFTDVEPQSWVNWAALALMAWELVACLVLVPRVVLRGPKAPAPEVAALIQWAFGLGPSLFGFAAIAMGASSWVIAVGFVVSAVILTAVALRLCSGR